jgi:hypothetical protein
MLLDIDPAVFEAADHMPVIRVLTLVANGRHDWRPGMAGAIRAERFVAKLASAEMRVPTLAEWARKAVEEAAFPHRTPVPAVRVPAGTLEEMVSDLEQPAILLVENRPGDGGFVRRVAIALGDRRIVDALDKMWLRFSHGGGSGDMGSLAAEECKAFRLLVRVAVLFDSDRRHEGDQSPNEKKAQQVREAGVREVHILAWREMENYLPFRVWEHHFPSETQKITGLRATPPHQRGYTDLKLHFLGPKPWPRGKRMPKPLIPDAVTLTEADFAELGPDVVPELRKLLAMIHRIL